MDVLLLGALAVILIALTLWIVMWPSRSNEALADEAPVNEPDEAPEAAVIVAAVPEPAAPASAPTVAAPAPEPIEYQAIGEPPSRPEIGREGTSLSLALLPRPTSAPRAAQVGLAAVVAGGAVAGVWLFVRWQQRQKPRRRFLR